MALCNVTEVVRLLIEFIDSIVWPTLVAFLFVKFAPEIRRAAASIQTIKYRELEASFGTADLREPALELEPPATEGDTGTISMSRDRQRHLRDRALDVLAQEFNGELHRNVALFSRHDLGFDAASIQKEKDELYLMIVVDLLQDQTNISDERLSAYSLRRKAACDAYKRNTDVDPDKIHLLIAVVTNTRGESYYQLESNLRGHFDKQKHEHLRIFDVRNLDKMSDDSDDTTDQKPETGE